MLARARRNPSSPNRCHQQAMALAVVGPAVPPQPHGTPPADLALRPARRTATRAPLPFVGMRTGSPGCAASVAVARKTGGGFVPHSTRRGAHGSGGPGGLPSDLARRPASDIGQATRILAPPPRCPTPATRSINTTRRSGTAARTTKTATRVPLPFVGMQTGSPGCAASVAVARKTSGGFAPHSTRRGKILVMVAGAMGRPPRLAALDNQKEKPTNTHRGLGGEGVAAPAVPGGGGGRAAELDGRGVRLPRHRGPHDDRGELVPPSLMPRGGSVRCRPRRLSQ